MNENIVITGAANGIGKELAIKFGENNNRLLLVDIDIPNLEKVKEEISSNTEKEIILVNQDLSIYEGANRLIQKLEELKFIPDVLINNAGFGVYGQFLNTDIELEEKMMILNITSLYKLTKYYSGKMCANGGGKIINISSLAGIQATPGLSVYSATKAFVLNFSEAIAYELKKENVEIKVFCPGPTKTNFAKTAKYSGKRTGNASTAEEVAEFIFKSIQETQVVNIYGFKSKMVILLQRLMPRELLTNITGKIAGN